MTTLTKERRGEIAEILLTHNLFENGFNLSPEWRNRELYGLSKKLQIPMADLILFFRPIAEKILDQVFNQKT